MEDAVNVQNCSPVFICGYPKSGTTLLLALLDRHPQLLVFPEESKFLKRVMRHPERQNLDYILTQTGANAFRFGVVHWSSGYRDFSSIDFAEYEKSLREHWGKSDGTERSLLESVVFSYGEVTGQINKRHWVEKTPCNERYLEKALAWWPELRAIYILRDPRDNYCSYRKKRGRDSKVFSLERFVSGWCESVRAWEQFAAHHANTLLIHYGNLVQHPRAIMQEVCNFLQVSWDDILLKPTRNGVFWAGNSMYDAKFEGISTASLGKYRDLLAPDEVNFLETWLGHIMMRYGWQLEQGTPSWRRAVCELFAGGDGSPILKLKMVCSLLRARFPVI